MHICLKHTWGEWEYETAFSKNIFCSDGRYGSAHYYMMRKCKKCGRTHTKLCGETTDLERDEYRALMKKHHRPIDRIDNFEEDGHVLSDREDSIECGRCHVSTMLPTGGKTDVLGWVKYKNEDGEIEKKKAYGVLCYKCGTFMAACYDE